MAAESGAAHLAHWMPGPGCPASAWAASTVSRGDRAIMSPGTGCPRQSLIVVITFLCFASLS